MLFHQFAIFAHITCSSARSRVFYETLLSQRPDSVMAQEWCVNHGVMDEEDAKKAFKRMEKRKAQGKSPATGSTGGGSGSGKKKKKKTKKVLDDVAVDAGMDAGISEGIGTSTL